MAKKERDSSFLQIDENQLDVEWLGQPELYYEWATKLADAIYDLDEAKAELELVQAEVENSIRSQPDKYGMEKITEKAVAAAVPMQQEYQDQSSAFNKAKHRVALYKATVDSLDQRKRALEKLVDLRLANYFSEPRAKTDAAKEEMDNVKKKSIRRGRRERE